MKVVAIADDFIQAEDLTSGLASLVDAGHDVTVLEWYHGGREPLQTVNLQVEQHGCNAVDLPQNLAEAVRGAEVVITQFAPLGDELVASSPDLKLVGVLRGGVENVAVETAQKRGIQVVNTPGRNARAVAEFAVGMILAEQRSIARTHEALRRGVWMKDTPYGDDIPEIGGKIVGVVGAGAIGRLVIQFLTGMDAICWFYDPYTDDVPGARKVESLDELMAGSDVVTVHSRLTSDNYHLIDERLIGLMKPNALLVNTARSGLVDEQAIIRALQESRIMAALDTFDVEPLPEGHPFLTLPNVTIAPHMAGSTIDAFRNTPVLLAKRLLPLMS